MNGINSSRVWILQDPDTLCSNVNKNNNTHVFLQHTLSTLFKVLKDLQAAGIEACPVLGSTL